MYLAPWTLNIRVENNTDKVLRGLEFKYLNDIGRTAKASKIKPEEYVDLLILTKDVPLDNKFILKTREGLPAIVDCNIIENTAGYILKISIEDVLDQGIKFKSEYIEMENAIA